jgi:hypothetical protein
MQDLQTLAGSLSFSEIIFYVLIFLEVVVNMTPSEKDNSLFLKAKKVLGFIFPNIKKGGGRHNQSPKQESDL